MSTRNVLTDHQVVRLIYLFGSLSLYMHASTHGTCTLIQIILPGVLLPYVRY